MGTESLVGVQVSREGEGDGRGILGGGGGGTGQQRRGGGGGGGGDGR